MTVIPINKTTLKKICGYLKSRIAANDTDAKAAKAVYDEIVKEVVNAVFSYEDISTALKGQGVGEVDNEALEELKTAIVEYIETELES
jgi:hypothetical protein